jgi:hypothetical protein
MIHFELTPAQREQVASMFLDNLFNTDPNAFDYEADRAGVITGRRPLQRREKFPRLKNPRVSLSTMVLEQGPDNRPAVRHLARLALQHLPVDEVAQVTT